MVKLYIIFTVNIQPIGGMQLYTAGKAAFLEKMGWKVVVFYPGKNEKNCAVSSLNKYTEGGNLIFDYQPAELSKSIRNSIYRKMQKYFQKVNIDTDTIYIESQSEITALWGEFFAKKLNAKHICFNCNEIFRGPKKHYEENIDFMKFKYKRKELLGLHTDTQKKIFEGYMDVPCDTRYLFDAVEPGPIQDVESDFVNKISECDWSIAYIGRAGKDYVENIVEGVSAFAKKYSEKNIQFIMVGNAECRNQIIQEKLMNISNLTVILPGDLVPIPRKLFEKIDVVIAGAVCAEISAREKVPTIVADCENHLACGVLGYTTMNSMYHEKDFKQTDFCEALEDTLVKQSYLAYDYAFPDAIPSDEIYQSHFDFFDNASGTKEYYNVEENSLIKKLSLKETVLAFLKLHYPRLFFKLYDVKKRLVYGQKRAGRF